LHAFGPQLCRYDTATHGRSGDHGRHRPPRTAGVRGRCGRRWRWPRAGGELISDDDESTIAYGEPISYGDTVSGEITEYSPSLRGDRGERYHFTGSAGEHLRVTAESDGFYPSVTLTRRIASPDAETTVDGAFDNDEDGSVELTTTLVASGAHGIWIEADPNFYPPDESGSFTLTLERVSDDEI